MEPTSADPYLLMLSLGGAPEAVSKRALPTP
jgi:hypothetical protein